MLKGDLVAFKDKPDELIGTVTGFVNLRMIQKVVVTGFEMGNVQAFDEELLVKFKEG